MNRHKEAARKENRASITGMTIDGDLALLVLLVCLVGMNVTSIVASINTLLISWYLLVAILMLVALILRENPNLEG